MQINREYEPEINLKDLFFHVLYRWRSILLFALIGAVALGAYQYFSVKATHDAGKLTKDEREFRLELQNYRENLEQTRTRISTLTARLEGQRKYRAKSIYINLDAQNVWTAQNKFLVKVDPSVLDALPAGSTIDPADSILPAYAAALSKKPDEQTLKDAFNTKNAEYAMELISIGTNPSDDSVTVLVRGSTKEYAEKGLELVCQTIKDLSAGKAQEINKHQLIDLGKTISLGADEGLNQKQINLNKAMTDDQKALQEARKTLDELEAKKEPTEPGDHVKKMAAIGFIVGAILLAGLYLFGYVLNGRLKDSSVLTEQYGLPVFGEFRKNGSLHHGRSLDKLISKWELGKDKADPQTVYDRIASLIEEQGEDKTLLLFSTLPEEKLRPVRESLASRLPGKTIETTGSFQENGEAIAEAAKAETVVLVEEKGVSRQKDIDSMAEALIISKANVIGAIVQ